MGDECDCPEFITEPPDTDSPYRYWWDRSVAWGERIWVCMPRACRRCKEFDGLAEPRWALETGPPPLHTGCRCILVGNRDPANPPLPKV